MCKCTPNIRTPFCGKPGCEWPTDAAMSPSDIERTAHAVRLQLQASTCCPSHAGEVLMRVLVGFALDDAKDNGHQAAAAMLRGVKDYADRVRSGEFRMIRSKQ